MLRSLLLCALVATALAAPALADCAVRSSRADVDTGDTPAGRFYVVEDCILAPSGCGDGLISLWVYQESNGVDGLQREDVLAEWDGCQPEPDTVLF